MPNGTVSFPPQPLPQGGASDTVPPAPPGTIFVMGPEGGYAVPRTTYTLLFGRDRDDVHVAVGVDDPTVSRRHGVFTCTGENGDWWLCNNGQLPIELPDGALLLKGHRKIVEPGHTPLVINSSKRRSHLMEVRLIDGGNRRPVSCTEAVTVNPEAVHLLSRQERLVITALAKRYLEGYDNYPQPMSWEDTARLANASPNSTKVWTNRTVANTVEDVRERLDKRGVRGLTSGQIGGPVGGVLNVNLIRELLKTATITAGDLDQLATDDED